MNPLEIKNNWNSSIAQLRQQWAMRTEHDLHYYEGMQEELLARIKKRNGQSRAEVENAAQQSSYIASE